MIEFDRSKDTLQALRVQDAIVLEDALGVFLDICEDIKSHGNSIENLDVASTDKLLANLSRSGRIFLKIMKKKAEQIESVDVGGRIKRQEEQLSVQAQDLEEKEKQLTDFENLVTSKVGILEDKKKEYEKRVKALDEKRQYLLLLEGDCQKLQTMIERLENTSVKPMEEKRAALQDEFDERKKSLDALEDQVDDFASKIAVVKKQFSDTKVVYDQKVTDHGKLQGDIKELNEHIFDRSERIRQLHEKEKELQGTVEELKRRQNQLNADVVMHQNEIDRLREHLANSDLDQILVEKEKLLKEKMALDETMTKEQSEYDHIRQTLQESRDEQIAKKEKFEKERSIILDENVYLKEKIDTLIATIDKEETERIQLEKVLVDTENRYRQLRKWFESLEVNKYEERLKNAQYKIRMFEEAQKELFYEMEEIGLLQMVSNQEANEKREELRVQLKEIETLLEVYRRKYITICGLLSD